MARGPSGHLEQLPSGGFRVAVYAGTDPLTGRRLRYRRTVKTEQQARIALGRLLEQASAGAPPDSGVTVAELLARYMEVAELEPSTRETYDGYIRRTILPALGSMPLRKPRGPVLDTFYARLRRCADLTCTRPTVHGAPEIPGPFHRPLMTADRLGTRLPTLSVPRSPRGLLSPGDRLLSVRELAARKGIRVAPLQHALAVLADEGLITVRQGRRAVVTPAPTSVSCCACSFTPTSIPARASATAAAIPPIPPPTTTADRATSLPVSERPAPPIHTAPRSVPARHLQSCFP